jgi:hypothetical protein
MRAGGLLLLLVGIFAIAARCQPRMSVGLLAIPGMLRSSGVIDGAEQAQADDAVRRLASWRRRGAVAGALAFALPALLARQTVMLSLVAILAGATSGFAAAQWWRMSRRPLAMRDASLARRTVTGLVGWRPVALLVTTTLAAAAGSVGWWVQRSHTGDKVLTAGRRTCVFHLTTPSLFGPLLGWASAVGALLIALGAAQAAARRAADSSLAEPVDLALRRAAIRTAWGCAITVTAGLAAGMIFVFRTLLDNEVMLQGQCATPTSWNGRVSDLLLFAGVACVLMAMTGLLSYVMFPGRRVTPTTWTIAA